MLKIHPHFLRQFETATAAMGSLESPRIVVGIDFGTTFSGFVTDRNVKSVLKADDDSIAWALEDCPDDIEVIQTWPAGGNSKFNPKERLINL